MEKNDSDSVPTAPTSTAASKAAKPLSITQRCWFFLVVVLGLVFILVLPPFQGSDEYPHWLRTWSVAEGQVRCGEVPQASVDARYHFRSLRDRSAQIALRHLDVALQQNVTQELTSEYAQDACRYPPFAYLVPAIVVRTSVFFNGRINQGDMLKAFYIGRAVNWLCLCLAVYWFIWAMPAFRNVGLFFLSIPEVIEQASQYNTDLTQFVFMLVLVATVLRKPTRRRVVTIGVLAVLLGVLKPTYAFFGLLALPALFELEVTRNGPIRKRVVVGFTLLLLLLPIVAWKLWLSTIAVSGHLPTGVNPGEQFSFLLHNPLHVFEVMWNQVVSLVGHNLMRGSWTSILGGLGPARVELPMAACYALLVGLASAIFADLTFSGTLEAITPQTSKRRLGRNLWAVATVGVATALPATVLAMYMFYTRVGEDSAYGIQGRYYLVSLFILMAFAIRYARSRWSVLHGSWSELQVPIPGSTRQVHVRSIAILIASLTCIWADLAAIDAVGSSYWFMG